MSAFQSNGSILIAKSEPSIVIPFLEKSVSVRKIRDFLRVYGDIKDIRLVEGKKTGNNIIYVNAIVEYASWFPSTKDTRIALLTGDIVTLSQVGWAIKAQTSYAKNSHFIFEFSPCKAIAPSLTPTSVRSVPTITPALAPTLVPVNVSQKKGSDQDVRQSKKSNDKSHVEEDHCVVKEIRLTEKTSIPKKRSRDEPKLSTNDRIKRALKNHEAYVEVDYSECGSIPPKCKKIDIQKYA